MIHFLLVPLPAAVGLLLAATPSSVEQEEAELVQHFIRAEQLKRLVVETPLIQQGQSRAFLAIPNDPAYRRRAEAINAALRAEVGTELPIRLATQVSEADLATHHAVLLGHLENNPLIARLYHLFYDCLDTGYTGRGGYEIRSVHDPFGTGKNQIVVGGSDETGADAAVAAFIRQIRQHATGREVLLPRLLVLELREEGRYGTLPQRLTAEQADKTLANELAVYDQPGLGRSAAHAIVQHAMLYHRYGDPAELEIYRKLILRHIRFYAEDPYVRSGMRRYDRDFRDSWAWKFVVTWDLLEEEPIFSDEERLAITNHCLRLVHECVLYQRWDPPERVARWAANQDIVHNHTTWPALACYFGARYFGLYYQHPWAKNWKTIADGIFNGQKRCAKPLEDAASYQWLPLRHTIIWSLAEGDHTFFEEGHARAAAETALMLTDNLGNQPAFGDHTDWKTTAGIPDLLGRCAWYYRDGRYLWGAQRAGGNLSGELLETYFPPVAPQPATDHIGIVSCRLPRQNYDYTARNPQYPTPPNLPYEATFDKLTFRSGLEPEDQYLLLDGFARGTHMHFDANAIIHFADRGACWLVDGEYIRNAPKYHASLTVLRDGESRLLPPFASLDRQTDLLRTGFTTTRVPGYNGLTWTRHLLWQKGACFVVFDQVTAEENGQYTLGSCWRVLGDPELEGSMLTCRQGQALFRLQNLEGLTGQLRFQRMAGPYPIYALTWRTAHSLRRGERVLLRNLFYASAPGREQSLTATPAGPSGVLVAEGQKTSWWGLRTGRALSRRGGVETDASLFCIAADRFALTSARRLSVGATSLFTSEKPVDIEVEATSGEGIVIAKEPTTVMLWVAPNASVALGEGRATADPRGRVRLRVPAGRHHLKTKPFTLPSAIAQMLGPEPAPVRTPATAEKGQPTPAVWTFAGVPSEPRPLRVRSVQSSAEPYGRYGPIEKLVDRRYSGSPDSVMWGDGISPVVTLDLGATQKIENIRLRVWELTETQKGTRHRVEVSEDGFQADIRQVPGTFTFTGTEAFGANINSLYVLPVGQKARYVRIHFMPASNKHRVYLAEIEVFGSAEGARAPITAMASGALGPQGTPGVVIATETGHLVALDATGKVLWEHRAKGAVNALAVADLDGDGRPEVIAGGSPAWLACFRADGTLRWEHRPAAYRGLRGDVITLAVGDLEADGRPEVVAGLLCWKYIAVDADGREKWDTIIYAHSASVCALADVDGNGRRSVIAGNVYYQLNLLGPDGAVRWQNYRFGPEHTAVAAADLNGDGKEEILAGNDLGEVHAIDGTGKRLWALNAGDAVRAVLVHWPQPGARPEVYAAGDSGFVYAAQADGALRWKKSVGDVIHHALLTDVDGDGQPEVVCAAHNAGVVILRRDGSVVHHFYAEAPVRHVQAAGPLLIAALEDGRLVAWTARP